MSQSATKPSLAQQLRDVVVAPRAELSISRHVFRSGPAYVLRDPVTFKTHRFDPADYHVLSRFDRSSTLGETFQSLVQRGLLEPQDEERFYEFVVDLHQRNLLSLPLGDGAVLYKRFERRRRAERIARLLGVFFLRVPLANPDRFLDRTVWLFRWLFTTPACIGWCVLTLVCLGIALARAQDLASPVLAMFTGSNLLSLWAVLIGLKVIHEFGHAYACKAFGGHVPEMGAYLVLFTPLAYVDATDAWSMPSMRQRAVVSLAGVYFESIVGAVALLVWAATEPSTLNTIAYQTVLLATVTTALFNLNPLLRYDAYYLLSDLTGIPNLRERCEQALKQAAKAAFFGVRTGDQRPPPWPMVAFGLAQLAYRVVIMVSIATVLVVKFAGLGIALAATLIGMTLGKAAMALWRFIATAPELAGRRSRAAVVSASGLLALLAAALLVPLPWPIDAQAVSTYATVQTIHAPSDGTLAACPVRPGQVQPPGRPMLTLHSQDLLAQQDAALAHSQAAQAQAIAAADDTPGQALAAWANAQAQQALAQQAQHEVQALAITAQRPVRVLEVHQRLEGTYVRRGQPLLTIGAGPREAIAVIPEHVYDRLQLRVGQVLDCRSSARPDRALRAVVTAVSPAGGRLLDPQAHRIADALAIATDPATGQATQSNFLVRLALDQEHAPPAGATLRVRLPARPMTTAQVLRRRIALFLNKLNRGMSQGPAPGG
ncbi:MAG: hypothetical protein KatS3mg103_0213 [Phycisphaerales bacterium]|nr:MAG: hypothetical protein KatS3mg103_0213 [Phycisphaerales bacterium]